MVKQQIGRPLPYEPQTLYIINFDIVSTYTTLKNFTEINRLSIPNVWYFPCEVSSMNIICLCVSDYILLIHFFGAGTFLG